MLYNTYKERVPLFDRVKAIWYFLSLTDSNENNMNYKKNLIWNLNKKHPFLFL